MKKNKIRITNYLNGLCEKFNSWINENPVRLAYLLIIVVIVTAIYGIR